jgi:hypothetical protein
VKPDRSNSPELADFSRAGLGAWQTAAEIVLVFVVFLIQGASPVPEVNEPYYLGKAIHFWNPQWIPNDFFLNTADTHKVFYFTFGWLALWLTPTMLAWVGRLLTWGLLAWSWRRLSYALIPRAWIAVLTAALFVCLQERFQMAGEWVIGGVEAKGFAFVLVFLGLEALLQGRWNRMWLLLGAASAFHVLVGGWATAAAALAWMLLRRDRPSLVAMLPALMGGLLLSLPGLIPSLALVWGVDAEVVDRANTIYVFERLNHHLAPAYFPDVYIYRFVAVVGFWALLEWLTPLDSSRRRLRMFVVASLIIALIGVAASFLGMVSPSRSAGLLKFYWFRLSDVIVPLAAALLVVRYAVAALGVRPRLGQGVLAAAILVAGLHVGAYALERPFPLVPKADSGRVEYWYWRDACRWIATPGHVPPDARFLTPLMSQTFKWYSGHSEVVNWKDIPQDPRSIVEWWDRIQDIYAGPIDESDTQRYESLARLGVARLERVGKKYRADYMIARIWPRLPLEAVYENEVYVIYRLPGAEAGGP